MPSNVMLVRWAGGWTEETNTAGVTAWGRREAMLSLGAVQSEVEAQRIAGRQLNQFADVRVEITADVEPISSADTPYLAFRVGDTVTVPGFDGSATDERVRAITVSRDEDGVLSFVPELKDRILDEYERSQLALKKMDNGTMRGQAPVASPVSTPLSKADSCCVPTVPPDIG